MTRKPKTMSFLTDLPDVRDFKVSDIPTGKPVAVTKAIRVADGNEILFLGVDGTVYTSAGFRFRGSAAGCSGVCSIVDVESDIPTMRAAVKLGVLPAGSVDTVERLAKRRDEKRKARRSYCDAFRVYERIGEAMPDGLAQKILGEWYSDEMSQAPGKNEW